MKTIVNFILDKSGSMESVREATISGFNEYIQTLKKDKKSQYQFTLTFFDTEVSSYVEGEDIKDVLELTSETYNPNGGTALYDAVCSTIKSIKDKGSSCKECGSDIHKQKILTVIMTDGGENASKEYTQVEMKKMIEERTKQGNWTFVFLGANQDSYAEAQKYGISVGNTANFFATSAGVGATMRGMATATTAYACSMSPQSADVLTSAKATIENTK